MSATFPSSDSRWNYVIFDYLTDPERGRTVPVGVALADPGTGRVMLRFPEPGEKVRSITGQRPRTLVQSTREQLMDWVSTGEVPYGDPGMVPGSSPWWAVVRDLLSFSVRARPPLAIDCTAPEDDLESLYEAVVGPSFPANEARERIDSRLKRALGDELGRRLQPAVQIAGYANKPVQVRCAACSPSGWVVVDAVNLSNSSQAEASADALASKLMRLRRGQTVAALFVGYLASPGGLNGETYLKRWIEEQTGARAFDTTTEAEAFRQAVARSLDDALGQQTLPL